MGEESKSTATEEPIDLADAAAVTVNEVARCEKTAVAVSFRQACMNRFEICGIVGCRYTALWRTANENAKDTRATWSHGTLAEAV